METPSPPPTTTHVAPRALRSLGDGIRLAHVHFLKLFPLALAVDWTLELVVTICTGGGPVALYRALLRYGPNESRATEGSLFLATAVAVLGEFLPMLVATAFLARAVRSLLRGDAARPLASLGAGLLRIHVPVVTAAAFSIVPIAVICLPNKFRDGPATAFLLGGGSLLAALVAILLVAAIIARFVVATPAAVIERRGLINAWRRSERLIDGAMWRVVGLVLLVGLVWALLLRFAVGTGVLLLAQRLAPDLLFGAPASSAALAIAFGRSAIEAWFHLNVGVTTTLLFEQLRRAKEGPDREEIQQVFS